MLKKLVTSIYLLTLAMPSVAFAQEAPAPLVAGLLISEIQTANETAGQEFIELYNASDEDLLLDGVRLQYASSAGTNWRTRAELDSITLLRSGLLLLSTEGYLEQPDLVFSSGLAATGGHLRLIDQNETVIDLVGWGSAQIPDGAAATAPDANQSIQRLTDDLGRLLDTDYNAADLELLLVPTPGELRTKQGEIETPQEPEPSAVETPVDEQGLQGPSEDSQEPVHDSPVPLSLIHI